MKIVESTRGRLVLTHRGLLTEFAILACVAIFGVLAWLVHPVDYWLSMVLVGCAVAAAVLFGVAGVRTTVIFDRVHTVVLIRRRSLLRRTEREVPLADVAEAMLLLERAVGPGGGGIVALAMRPGSRRATLPLTADALPDRDAAETLGAINRWLAAA